MLTVHDIKLIEKLNYRLRPRRITRFDLYQRTFIDDMGQGYEIVSHKAFIDNLEWYAEQTMVFELMCQNACYHIFRLPT